MWSKTSFINLCAFRHSEEMSTNSLPDRGAGSVSGSSGSRPSGLSYANYQKPSTASSYGGGSLSGRMYRDGEWLFHFVSHARIPARFPALLRVPGCGDRGYTRNAVLGVRLPRAVWIQRAVRELVKMSHSFRIIITTSADTRSKPLRARLTDGGSIQGSNRGGGGPDGTIISSAGSSLGSQEYAVRDDPPLLSLPSNCTSPSRSVATFSSMGMQVLGNSRLHLSFTGRGRGGEG